MEKGATCRKCGLSSVLTRHFKRGYCPACRKTSPGYVSTAMGLYLIGVGAAVIGLLVYLVLRGDGGWHWHGRPAEGLFWPIIVAWLLRPVRLLVHEASHYLAARALGWNVAQVKLFGGGTWFTFRTGETEWVVGRLPYFSGGACLAAPAPDRVTRAACAFYCAAPSLVQVALAAGLAPWFDWGTFGGRLAIALSAFLVLDTMQALRPRSVAGPFGESARSDGAHLRRLFRTPAEAVAKWRSGAIMLPALRPLRAGKQDKALEALERAAAQFPDDRRTRGFLAACYHACGAPEQALQRVEDYAFVHGEAGGFTGDEAVAYLRGSLLVALDRLDEVVALSEAQRDAAKGEEARARWSACLALALLLRAHDAETVERAAAESAYAFARLPWVDYVATAQGMALVEKGDHDGGLRLLKPSKEAGASESGLRPAWRVVAHAARGKRETAVVAMEDLRGDRLWPACVRRAEAALASLE